MEQVHYDGFVKSLLRQIWFQNRYRSGGNHEDFRMGLGQTFRTDNIIFLIGPKIFLPFRFTDGFISNSKAIPSCNAKIAFDISFELSELSFKSPVCIAMSNDFLMALDTFSLQSINSLFFLCL
jgi:hypothetical protein